MRSIFFYMIIFSLAASTLFYRLHFTVLPLENNVITEANFAEVMRSVSNRNRELVFTTFSIHKFPNGSLKDPPGYGMTAFNVNFVRHLNKARVFKVLVVGLSEDACAASMAAGVHCFVDAVPWMKKAKIYNGRHVALKWYYMRRMVQLGFHPLFLDNDVAVLKNPFHHWDRSYDLQGLSDVILTRKSELPALAVDTYCPVNYGVPYPCMSTGVMYLRATESTLLFLKEFVRRLEKSPSKWEQGLFQRAIMPHLIRMGDGPSALKFRLLPISKFHNVKDYIIRKINRMQLDSVIVHCGRMKDPLEKQLALQALDMWFYNMRR